MEIFDYSKSIVENASYLSGPIIALLGLIVFFQLRLAKKATVITSKRQAAELSTKQIEIYYNVIIPLHTKFMDLLVAEKFDNVEIRNLKNFTSNELSSGKEDNLLEEAEFLHKNVIPALDAMNSMEAFSTYFIKGVADEEIAFSSLGRTFCYTVKIYSFVYCILRDGESHDVLPYENTIKLYDSWNSQLNSKRIESELKKKTEELKKIKIEKINILGTK
jgi:hypothetical protein